MKLVYDPDRDILQISFNKTTIEETAQLSPGIILDYDEDGRVIGFEVRRASQRLDDPQSVTYTVGKANMDKPPMKGDTYT
ncbi:MAG: DUF2283 domain-containing protein [Cyanobacteria bacterium P01_D01_bin.105]